MNSQKLNAKINNLSIRVATAKGIKERINFQCSTLKEKIDNSEEDIKTKKEAHLLLLGFISQRRDAAIKSIESMGTYALRAIYNDDRKLVFLKNEEKKSSAAFKMEVGIESTLNDEKMITGLKDERGGGVLETASFALRIAALEWLGYKGPLMLDEAYKSVSSDSKIVNVAEFLRKYVDTSERQVFFATHKADVFEDYADNVIVVRQHQGISKAETKGG
jgi:ABC-type Mn2+/Zn2+ transport system ATPase subunit